MLLSREFRLAAVTACSLFAAACGRLVPAPSSISAHPREASSATLPSATQLGYRSGPAIADLGLGQADASAALLSFGETCSSVTTREDASGLTRPGDWKAACAALAQWPNAEAAGFFQTYFETVQVGDGRAYATGYYEPEIAGSRTHMPGYDTPVYAKPSDLVNARPGDAPPLVDGRMPLGRYDEQGTFVAYYDRSQIENGALADRGLEIAWVRDPVEFFFLQVQGSGRLRLPDGGSMRIGYSGRNGFVYTGIGAVLRDRGLVGEGPGQYPGSMQGIVRYIRDNPAEGRALMRENRSWIFFREVQGEGPLGALSIPLQAESSIAVDPRFVPLGAPVWLDLDRSQGNGLWIAQDTGGAIKGANRFDTFWGSGEEAGRIAGGMIGRGRALILLPKGTLVRLGGR